MFLMLREKTSAYGADGAGREWEEQIALSSSTNTSEATGLSTFQALAL